MKSSSLAKIFSLMLAVLLIVIASGCQYILPKEEELLPPPLVKPMDVVYNTIDVTRGDMVSSVQGVARFESVKMVDIYYTTGGRIKSIDVKNGDIVRQEQTLMQLDTSDLDFNLEIEKLRLQQMKNNYASQPLANAAIDITIQKMVIQRMEQQQDEAVLKAPIDGAVVYVTSVNVGNAVDAYTTLVRIADQSAMMLSYENDANRYQFQIGMKVQVTLNSNGSTCEGEIVSTPFERDKLDSEVLANLLFIKVPDNFLTNAQVGDEAKVMLILAQRKNVLILPHNVVKAIINRRYVDVLENGVKVEKDVQVGLETPTQCEILSGLKEGEKVIS